MFRSVRYRFVVLFESAVTRRELARTVAAISLVVSRDFHFSRYNQSCLFSATSSLLHWITRLVCNLGFRLSQIYLTYITSRKIRFLWNRRVSFGGSLLLLCRYLPFGSFLQAYGESVAVSLNVT